MQRAEKQTARLTDFNSKSSCPSLLLKERVHSADKPLLLKKKNQKSKESQRQQHHRKRNFLSPSDFHLSALHAGLLTAETSSDASEGSAPLALPTTPMPPPLLLLLRSLPHPKHPALPAHFPSPKESTPLAPKVWQIVILNFRAEPGSN